MKAVTKKRVLIVAGIFAALALLNPRYSYVHVEGPKGPVKAEKFAFGPGGYINYTRVLADKDNVTVEMGSE